MREVNERFVMVPVSLLDVPEFVRYFDSKAIGSIYRVLVSKVWRKSSFETRKNSSKRIKKLAEFYEKGYLVSMHELSSLAEAVGYDERTVRREINMLEYLNLIKIHKEEKNTYYVVGEVGLIGKSGASMGMMSEGFYLDFWRDFAYLTAEFSPKLYELFREDIRNLFKDGQICHNFLTNLSLFQTIEDLKKLEYDAIYRHQESPLKEKVKELNTIPASQPETPKEDYMAEIRTQANPQDAISIARKHLRDENLTLSQIKLALNAFIDTDFSAFAANPMFAIRLAEYSQEGCKVSEQHRIVNLWVSLREDLTGIPVQNSGKEFARLVAIARNMLKKYSFKQILWVMKKVVRESKNDAEFMSKGVNSIEFFIKKHSSEYQAIRDHRLHLDKSHARINDSQEEEEVDDEPLDPNTGRMFSLMMGEGGVND